MNARWLFICSCLALITSAFTFSIRQDIQQDLGDHFAFSQEFKGVFGKGAFEGMAASMLVGAFICDALGMKKILFLALFSHIASTIGLLAIITGNAPATTSSDSNWWLMYGLFFLQGCGNGLTEVAINPLVATLYPRDKTHFLNVLHAWWPGGLIIGGLLALFIGETGIDLGFFAIEGLQWSWQTKLYLILIPAALYGLMLIPARFPETEAVQSGVSMSRMFMEILRPLFLIWAFCMVLTSATELGPQQWQESVMKSVTGGNVSGTLILVYTSTLMFVLRHFAGPIAHSISPIGLNLVSAILAGVGLYLLSYANDFTTAFGYATIFGLGIAYFWPTMLGVTAERFPKGGAMLLALMGCIGNLSISQVLPRMGGFVDQYAVEHLEQSGGTAVQFITTDNGKKFLNTQKLAELETSIVELLLNLQRTQPDMTKPLFNNQQVQGRLAAMANEKEPNIGLLRERALAKGALNLDEIKKLAPTNPEIDQLNRLLLERAPVRAAEAYGFSMAFRLVSRLPILLVFIFGAIWIYDYTRGGYKPEILISQKEHDELLSGGAQGPIE